MIRASWPLLLALLAAPCRAQTSPDFDALVSRGDLPAAEALARAGGNTMAVRLGDVMVLQGRLEQARVVYQQVRTANGPDWRSAVAGLAELAMRRGDKDEARLLASSLTESWRRDHADWSARDELAAGRALELLADGNPQAVRDALAAYDASTAKDPDAVAGPLAAADLFLAHYKFGDASDGYRAVLERHPRLPVALLGMARVAAYTHQGDAMASVRDALAGNPRLVAAQLLRARLQLEAEQYDSARVAVDAALAADSTTVEGWAMRGALAWLAGDSATWHAAEATAARLDRRPAGFYAEVAEAAARHRRYAEAVVLADHGVALDSNSVPALTALGNNLLRTGEMTRGRAVLERAFALDGYNLWNKNTLDLLDYLASYGTVARGRFAFVAAVRDTALLGMLLSPLLEEAYDTLASRYDYRPPTPIRIEVYDRHADFSVRTIGLTGLGALGVSFGPVVVLDAPEARDPGEFNLGSTAWHELAHTFTLGRSGFRVPRWISEGLSVLEERRARVGWGAHASMVFAQALAAGDLLPIVRLNDGFVRPDRPERLGLSYYQASLVMEYLEREKGIAGIRTLLSRYAAGDDTPAAFRAATGLAPEAFQAGFDRWIGERFAQPVAAIKAGEGDVFVKQMQVAAQALSRGDSAAALRLLESVRDRYPEYGDEGGPRFPLAMLHWRRGDRAAALREIAVVTASDETALAANRTEAAWRLEAGDTTGALAALARASWIAPAETAIWRERAEVAQAAGAHAAEVLSRRALLALRPADPIAARTDLAAALLRSGDPAAARRELLGVLEQAPSYERAQELLLDARVGGRPE